MGERDQFYLVVNDLGNAHSFDEVNYLIELRINMLPVIPHNGNSQQGPLPPVILSDFGQGNVKTMFYPIFDLSQHLPFPFQGGVPRQIQLNLTYTDNHTFVLLKDLVMIEYFRPENQGASSVGEISSKV